MTYPTLADVTDFEAESLTAALRHLRTGSTTVDVERDLAQARAIADIMRDKATS